MAFLSPRGWLVGWSLASLFSTNRRISACYAQTYRLLFFVGHTVNEIHEIWQEISRRGFFHNGTKFDRLIDGALLYIRRTKIGELWPGDPHWSVKNIEGCEKNVSLFSYIVWPNAMKCGMMRGISA